MRREKKPTNVLSYSFVVRKSYNSLTGIKSRYQQGSISFCSRGNLFLPFAASRGYPHFLPCGSIPPTSKPAALCLADRCSIFISPSLTELTQERFSHF